MAKWIKSAQALRIVRSANPGSGWHEYTRILIGLAARERVATRCLIGDMQGGHMRNSWSGASQDISGPIEAWIWAKCTDAGQSKVDLEAGSLLGRGYQAQHSYTVRLRGIEFDGEELAATLGTDLEDPADGDDDQDASLPRIEYAPLKAWWDKLAARMDMQVLSVKHLVAMARADHPGNRIPRAMIEDLGKGRKTGPK